MNSNQLNWIEMEGLCEGSRLAPKVEGKLCEPLYAT